MTLKTGSDGENNGSIYKRSSVPAEVELASLPPPERL